jgi:hypothetical protein
MTGIALIGVALFVQLSTSPIEGHWVANLAKSKLSPAFPFHSATLDVVVKGDAVSFTDKVVTAPGKEEGHSNLTFISDGKEHAFEGTPLGAGVVSQATWLNPRTLQLIIRKDAKEITTQTWEVSSDGKTLTSVRTGMLEQVVVFERR